MQETNVVYGNLRLNGVLILHKGLEPYIASPDVRRQMKVSSYESLNRRGLEPLNPDAAANKQFINYFREVASPKGTQYLYPLYGLRMAEANPNFEGVFLTNTFFTDLHDRFLNYVKVETENNLKFLEKHGVQLVENVPEPEPIQPPRKSIQDPSNLVQEIKQHIDNLTTRLGLEVAIARLQNDPVVIEEATRHAAHVYLEKEGKAIADAWQQGFDEHKAQEEQSLKRTREERDQIKADIVSEQTKLRRIQQDVKDLEEQAQKRASQASYVPRAGKAPMLNSLMQAAFRKG